MADLKDSDKEIFEIIQQEGKRIRNGLEMIPSENFVSKAVLQTLGSYLNCKYSEGYPEKRYYGGNEFIDKAETLAINRAKKAFNVPHANVQPYSGSSANLAVYFATCNPGEVIMGQSLPDGGHLTHGWKASMTGKLFKSVQYSVKEDGYLDLEEIKKLAQTYKPKLIWVGATSYAREFPFEELGKIADEVGAYLAADISHIAGLVVAGVHKSPARYAHIITTTTHKTLRGPRGSMIMVTEKGLKKDPELAEKIDKTVFPGMQGGPHDNQTAAIAVCLKEALTPEFKIYAENIIKNSKKLAQTLMENKVKLVSNGTDNHLCLIDLTNQGIGKGVFLQEALEQAGITVNKNSIPRDKSSPFYPSGVRLGVPAITTRGMGESEMQSIGKWIAEVVEEIKKFNLPEEKEQRKIYLQEFKEEIKKNQKIKQIREQVLELCKKFPLYPDFDVLS